MPDRRSSSPCSRAMARMRAVSVSAAVFSLRSRTSSIPAIAPMTRTSPTSACSAAHVRMRSSTTDPIRAARSGSRSSRMTSMTARPAAQATGLPANVPPRPPGARLLGAPAAVLVWEWGLVDLRRVRPEVLLVRIDGAGEAEGEQRPAVKAAAEADDGFAPCGGAGDLDRVFHRLGSSAEEDRLLRQVARRDLAQALGEA